MEKIKEYKGVYHVLHGVVSMMDGIGIEDLNIKPLLKGNENGQIVSFAKERGRKNALNAMAKKYDTLGVDYENQTVCIAHAGCEEDAAYLDFSSGKAIKCIAETGELILNEDALKELLDKQKN